MRLWQKNQFGDQISASGGTDASKNLANKLAGPPTSSCSGPENVVSRTTMEAALQNERHNPKKGAGQISGLGILGRVERGGSSNSSNTMSPTPWSWLRGSFLQSHKPSKQLQNALNTTECKPEMLLEEAPATPISGLAACSDSITRHADCEQVHLVFATAT
jgi:hypothetical protein